MVRRKHEERFAFIGAEQKSVTSVLKSAASGGESAALIKATVISIDNHLYKFYKIYKAAGAPRTGKTPSKKVYRIMVDHFRGNAFGTDDQGSEQEIWTKEDLQHMLSMLETTEGILKNE